MRKMMNTRKIFSALLFLACYFTLSASSVWAQQTAVTSSQTLGLERVFWDLAEGDWEEVKRKSAEEAKSPSRPVYKSNRENLVPIVFDGYFVPNSDSSKLAVHSDDGVTVEVNGAAVHSRLGNGQSFPYLDQSLHEIKPDSSGSSWRTGQPYHIRILYRNTALTGPSDIDGMTLFAYNGGGSVGWRWRGGTSKWSGNDTGAREKYKQFFVRVHTELNFEFDPNNKTVRLAVTTVTDNDNADYVPQSLSEVFTISLDTNQVQTTGSSTSNTQSTYWKNFCP